MSREVIWHRIRIKATPPDGGIPTWIECQMAYKEGTDILKAFKDYCKMCYEPLVNHIFELISID